MYRPNDARFGFARWWYWCGSRLWRGRIKIVSVGAQAGLVISRLMRFFVKRNILTEQHKEVKMDSYMLFDSIQFMDWEVVGEETTHELTNGKAENEDE